MKSLLNDWQHFMRENKDSKTVAKAVIYIGDEILLLLHERGWDLPGGHIKQEEDIIDGLKKPQPPPEKKKTQKKRQKKNKKKKKKQKKKKKKKKKKKNKKKKKKKKKKK